MAEIVANCPGPVQQAHFPAFDIGFDEIESIEPECGDDGDEGGQGDNLLRDCVPAFPGVPRWARPKPRPPRLLTGRVNVPSSEPEPSAIGNTATLARPCSHTTLRRIERA